MTLPKIGNNCSLDCLIRLLNTPSPTGYTEQAIELVEHELKAVSALEVWRTRKGGWSPAGPWKGLPRRVH